MSDPFIGQISMFAGNFAPRGYAFCQGQILSIAQNNTLYVLIGTTYGGDGVNTFALPDLRGRLPVGQGIGGGATYVLGQSGGVETVTLTAAQLPAHTHALAAAGEATGNTPAGALLAPATSAQSGVRPYSTAATPNTTLNAQSVTPTGGNQPHDNRQPYLCFNFIIALEGIFPSQN